MTDYLIKLPLLIVCVALLSSCSSKPIKAIEYYLLDPIPEAAVAPLNSQLVEIKMVTLPAYLKGDQLLVRDARNRLQKANYHYWADDFPASVRRALVSHLENSESDYSFVVDCSGCPKLEVNVEHFYPTSEGRVVLSGDFLLRLVSSGDAGASQDIRQRFSYLTPIDQDGFARSVELMNQLLADLSVDIMKQLP